MLGAIEDVYLIATEFKHIKSGTGNILGFSLKLIARKELKNQFTK